MLALINYLSSSIFLSMSFSVGILVASFLGSGHCIAMCGGLVMNFATTKRALVFYHLGRLISYSMLGALAGAFGSIFFSSSISPALGWIASLFFGFVLMTVGVMRIQGKPLHFKMPPQIRKLLDQTLGLTLRKPVTWFTPVALGFLSAFLPCGWLYTFVFAASATKSAALGALSLTFFWLGTVPALSAASAILNQASSKLRMSTPKLSGILMIGLGIFSLSLHTAMLFKCSVTNNTNPSVKQAIQSCPLHAH